MAFSSACVLVVAGGALFVPAPRAAAAPDLPAQGVYDWCTPSRSADHCASRLRLLSAAGFQVVHNAAAFSADPDVGELLAFADAARSFGVKVIWPFQALDGAVRRALPRLAARCGCEDEESMLAYLVAAVRGHPATWGYYIADEPKPGDRDQVAAFAARVRRLDPVHPRLVMGCGNCYGGEGSVGFMADVDAALGTDIYPVWAQAPDQPIVARRVAAAAAGLRRVADRAGQQAVIALQAWRWGDSYYDSQATGIGQASRYPTRREIRDQRNAAIKHGRPDLILWFTLNQTIGWEAGQRPWHWAEPSDPMQRWSNLVGGAFSPLGRGANKRPVARFRLRSLPRGGTVRVVVDAASSYDPDGRIVRYRWYVSSEGRAICSRRRCLLTLRRGCRCTIKLVVTDSRGVRSSRRRWVAGRSQVPGRGVREPRSPRR